MAVAAVTIDERSLPNHKKITWAVMANGDTGTPVFVPNYNDKTVHIDGTFGAGGSVNIEGSKDGNAPWIVLKDAYGSALTKTANACAAIGDNPLFIRPNVTAGDGTTAINVTIGATKGAR